MEQKKLLALIEQAAQEGWTELDLSREDLISLPPEISKLTQLKLLNLSDNQLSKLPAEVCELTQLISFGLSRNQLSELPVEIGKLIQLQKLSLTANSLGKLPIEIGRLTQLKELSLHNNLLDEFPLEICQLTQLTELSFSYNQLNKLPVEISQLTQLKELYLYRNQLIEIPIELTQLTQLTVLYLGNNQLSELPAEIGRLTQLKELYLYNNHLSILPAEIGQLAQLEALYLGGNELTQLPLEFRSLQRLSELELRIDRVNNGSRNSNDNLKFPPQDVVGNDNIRSILAYLESASNGYAEVWQSKCVVVGEGGVGKTWLINALRGNQPDPAIVGTVGIDIVPLELPHPYFPTTTMQLNCWDFAGQDFNHAMHQFFFSNRALILLVWNARHGWEQGKLTRWLDNIKVRAPKANVILVATHIDEPHSGYPKIELQANYPQIAHVIEVSSKTGVNIDQLRTHIQTVAAQLPLMGVKWPLTWLSAANAVRALKTPQKAYTTRSEVYATMQQVGTLNDEQCGILLRWLHELGDMLNFADEDAIADYVILDPEWLTENLGSVLRSDHVLERKGILSRQHLRTLWPTLDEHIRTLLLHIMDKFDLAYLIPDDADDRSLIVERLPLDPPEYQTKWQEFKESGSEITLRFKLDSIQPGIPTWFIARCHRFTLQRDGEEGVHWINGVLFQDEQAQHRALIIANDHDRIVEMRVRGPFPQRFMSLLRDGFRDTLKRYQGLKVERLVPCPGFNELEEKTCENEFRLDQLELWLKKKPDRILFTCPECDTELSRLKLVEGIGSSELTQRLTEQRLQALLDNQTTKIISHSQQMAKDLARYIERNFLREFVMQQDRELITCPNIFTIQQVALSSNVIRKHKWRIQLFSQQPGDWRPAGEPYLIDELSDWFKKAVPFLQKLHKVLKIVAPVAGRVLDVAGDASDYARDQHDIFANEIDLMGKMLSPSNLLDAADNAREQYLQRIDPRDEHSPRKYEGADLVVIRELMDKLAEIDQQRGTPKWGGLTRRQTPEGDILWLDKEHLEVYLSRRQMP